MSTTDRDQIQELILAVDQRDGLDDVLGRLWRLAGQPVRLVIPSGVSLFLTASEFRRLKEVVEQRGVALTVETEDPLRVQLAGLFRLRAVRVGAPLGPRPLPDPPRPAPAATGPRLVVAPPDGNGHGERPALPDLPIAREPAAPLPPIASNGWDTLDLSAPDAPRFREPGQPFTLRAVEERSPLTTPTRAPGPPPRPEAPPPPPPAPVVAPPAGLAPVSAPVVAGDGRFEELRKAAQRREAAAERRRLDRAVIVGLGGVLLLLLLAGASALYILLPRATVTLELREQTLVAELPFRVLAPGEEAGAGELAVVGQEASVEVAFTATVATTGTAPIGVTAAWGRVQLANPGPEPVTIPAETVAVGDTGVEIRFREEVTVPAAAEGAAGRADAAVEVVQPGSSGNFAVGELSGRLDSGVYFANRLAPFEGGTDRDGQGVAQADLDGLVARFEEELPALAEARLAETLPAGLAVAAGSLTVGEPEIVFDRAAGEAGEQVTLNATVTVSALAFRLDEVMAAAEPRLRAELERLVPAGYQLDPTATTISRPESPAEPAGAGAQVIVTASGAAVYRFSDEERATLVDALEGESAGEAAAMLRELPAVERFEVDYFPGGIFERMPRDGDRIELVIRD